MTSVYVLDSNNEIVASAGEALNDALVCDNEVQLLNEMEQSGFAIVLLHHAVRHQETAAFVERLKKVEPVVEIVVIGGNLQDEEIMAYILAGANGYQDVATLDRYVEKMLRVITNGEAWVSRRLVGRLIAYWRKNIQQM